MSDGLRRLAGTPTKHVINDVEYTFDQMTLGVLAEIESHIVSHRPNVLLKTIEIIDKIPEAMRESVIDRAMVKMTKATVATNEETKEYLTTFVGVAHLFWILVRHHHPEIKSIDDAVKAIGDTPLTKMQALIDLASGMTDLKNSNGQTEAAATGLATA